FYRLDQEFLRQFVAAGGGPRVPELLHRARAPLDRVRRLSLPGPDVIEELIDQHSAVLQALERNDIDQAEASLRHHLRGVYRVLVPLRDAHPDYFVPSEDGDGDDGDELPPSTAHSVSSTPSVEAGKVRTAQG